MSPQVVSTEQARKRLRDIVDAVRAREADVVIERYGKPMVAVIPYEDYAALMEDLEDLRDGRRAAAAYEEWKRDPSTGRPLEEVEAELRAEGLLDD